MYNYDAVEILTLSEGRTTFSTCILSCKKLLVISWVDVEGNCTLVFPASFLCYFVLLNKSIT